MTTGAHEQSHGEAPAGQAELSELFIRSKGWLERNGAQFIDDPDLILGSFQGVPIANVSPRLYYTLPGDVVREHAPAAADTLNIGSSFTLTYKQPHFSQENPQNPGSSLVRKTPKCEYSSALPMPQMEVKTLSVELTLDDEYQELFVDEHSTEIRSLFGMEASDDESGTGTHITMREYKAIDEI